MWWDGPFACGTKWCVVVQSARAWCEVLVLVCAGVVLAHSLVGEGSMIMFDAAQHSAYSRVGQTCSSVGRTGV